MRLPAKLGLVAAGYVAAFVLAAVSVAIYAAWADSPILLAPLVTLAFLLSGAFAPRRPARMALCGAAVTEVFVFASWLMLYPR